MLHRTYKAFEHKLSLSAAEVDLLSLKLSEFLRESDTDRTEALRVQLYVEEILLRWQEFFGAEKTVMVRVIYRFGQPSLLLTLNGTLNNPLQQYNEALGEWSSLMLNNIGLSSSFTYHNGRNRVQIRLHKTKRNPAATLLLSIFFATLVNLLVTTVLADTIWIDVMDMVFQPIYDVYFRILNASSGPAVFLSVLVVVYGIGNMSSQSNAGHQLVRLLLFSSFIMSAFAGVICLAAYSNSLSPSDINIPLFVSLLELVLSIIPADIITPFTTGDSPALFFLALILGNAILLTGAQADTVAQLGMQANSLMQTIMEWLGNLLPYFIFVILVFRRSIHISLQLLKPALLLIAISAALMAMLLFYLWLHCRFSPRRILNALRSSFLTALSNASSTAAFNHITDYCCNRLGVNKTLVAHGIPLGLVVYMPLSAISFLVFSFQMAQYYSVSINTLWVITAIILATLLAIASPPIPSVNLMAYAVLFNQLGIPPQGLIFALVADTIFGFLASAMNTVCLELLITLHAYHLNLMDDACVQKLRGK